MENKSNETVIADLMKRAAPIRSLLETDLYKFSMAQFVTHRYPGAWVRVDFKCRSDVKVGWMKPVIDKWLDEVCTIRFSDAELDYLRTLGWLATDFIDYLRRFYLFRDQIHTGVDGTGQLTMYAEGPWRDAIWFEIPCLAMVEEAYMYCSEALGTVSADEVGMERMKAKVDRYNRMHDRHPFTFSDFGIRRRRSSERHDKVVEYMSRNCRPFVGTSDVYLAKKYGVKPMGTMAHELYMGLEGCRVQLREVQKETWRQWMEEYRGKNGVLLSDIFGFNACLKDMDWYVANSFQGCRHDSGDPFRWGHMLIDKYKSLNIDPMTKVACWSDCLDPDLIEKITDEFAGKINMSFGVGTNTVNDCGYKPLSIVMKLTMAGYDKDHMTPVLKLSDDDGKVMCPDQALVEYAKHVYNYNPI